MSRPLLAIATIVAISVPSLEARAQNVHLLPGSPRITSTAKTLTLEACVAGLGNKDIQVSIRAEEQATVVLLNPSGFLVPGQNKVAVLADATATISQTEIKNGSVCFWLTASAPKTVDPLKAGAPNANWTAVVQSVAWTRVSLTIRQGGSVVLQKTISN